METKIVPYEFSSFDDGEIIVDKVTVSYMQKNDSSGEDIDGTDGAQEITLTARSNGLARFVNIKTDSWSIENADEFKLIVEDFERRAGIPSNEEILKHEKENGKI